MPVEFDSPLSPVESIEFPRECAPGTDSRFPPLFHFCVGDDTLCGDVGLLALLSNDPALRNSGEALLSILELLLSITARGTESLVPLPPAADVSMVMVGALARRGAAPDVSWSAMVVAPNVSVEAVVDRRRGRLYD